MNNSDLILVREVAKAASDYRIIIGQNRLYDKLRDWGWLLPRKSARVDFPTEPYQNAIDAGWVRVVSRTIIERGTEKYQKPIARVCLTTYITQKGMRYILKRLCAENNKTYIEK